MHAWDNPTDRDRTPSDTPDEQDQPTPDERPPFDRDPEAQRAPGADQETPDAQPPPMRADAAPTTAGEEKQADDAIIVDAEGVARVPVGNDTILEGRANGVMGPPHASQGQGQGG